MKMERRAPAPTPTYQEICAFAERLARLDGVDECLIELIHYPVYATPPDEVLRQFMGWAARIRAEAAALLKEQLAALPRPRIRRRRRVSFKPVRAWTWTRAPLKNGAPSRRRNFLLPALSPPIAAPPRILTDGPAWCPSRRERSRPNQTAFTELYKPPYVQLFDNRIVV